jgi:hypothetical protein
MVGDVELGGRCRPRERQGHHCCQDQLQQSSSLHMLTTFLRCFTLQTNFVPNVPRNVRGRLPLWRGLHFVSTKVSICAILILHMCGPPYSPECVEGEFLELRL